LPCSSEEVLAIAKGIKAIRAKKSNEKRKRDDENAFKN